MKNFKKISILTILIVSFLLSGCGKKNVTYMDRPADDGKFYYTNQLLGFNVVLPKEFDHYQTQRVAKDDYVDIEFYVPTSDTVYVQEVSGYAKMIVIRAYKKPGWDKVNHNEKTTIFKKFGETGGNVLTVYFNDVIPKDWKDKWTDQLKNDIKNNLSIVN